MYYPVGSISMKRAEKPTISDSLLEKFVSSNEDQSIKKSPKRAGVEMGGG